jgi:hypothetical protein
VTCFIVDTDTPGFSVRPGGPHLAFSSLRNRAEF